MREGSTGLISSTGEGALLQHNRFRAKQQFMNKRKATCRVLCAKDLKESKVKNDGSPQTPKKLTLDRVMKESKQRVEERKKHELETKEKMDRMLLNIQSHAGHQGVNDLAQSLNQSQNTIALHVSTHIADPKPNLNTKGPLSRKTGFVPIGQSSSYVTIFT